MKYRLSGVRTFFFFLLASGYILFGSIPVRAESAADWITRGNRFYAEERYQDAIEAYRHALQLDPTSPVVQYNLGTALARSGRDAEAIKALAQSTQSAQAPVQKRDAWFNLGVTDAETAMPSKDGAQGGEAAPADPQQEIKQLSDSVHAFREAILSDPEDIQAKHNYELTLDRLEKLKQQQQQQQKQQSDQNKDQEKKDQDQQNNDQQQNQQQQDKKSDQQKNDQNQNQQNQDQNQQKNGQQQNQQNQNGNQQDQQKNNQQQNQPQDKKNGQQQKDDKAGQDKGLEQNQQQQKPQENKDQKDQQKPSQADAAQGSNGASGSASPDPQLTPDQMDALRVLNLLEKEKPEQFKQLFQFKGSPSHQLEKDW